MGGWSRLVFLWWRDPKGGHTSSRTECTAVQSSSNFFFVSLLFDFWMKRRRIENPAENSQLHSKQTDKSNHT